MLTNWIGIVSTCNDIYILCKISNLTISWIILSVALLFIKTWCSPRYKSITALETSVKCAPPLDGAVALGTAEAWAFQASISPEWMKHLIMVTGGNWCFWNCWNTQIFVISFPSCSFFLFSPPAYTRVFHNLQNLNKGQEMYFKCHC